MTKVGDNYLSLVDKFIFNGGEIRYMNMSEEQKLRTLIAYEAYQTWMSNKQIQPMDLCRRISSRIYGEMLRKAEHEKHYADLCQKLNIRKGVQRDASRLANDVATFDHIVGRFNAPTVNIEKAKVQDAASWLIAEGMKSGNDRSVSNGAKILMDLNKNFDAREQGYENLADTDINITGDVSVVKPGRENYSDEYKRKLARDLNIPIGEVDDLIKREDGVYETAPQEEDDNRDIFERGEDFS